MKVKNKSMVGIMVLAIMLLFGLSSTAEAVIVAYPGGITIANNATTSQKLGSDITLTGEATDFPAGSTVSVQCPTGLRFDSTNVGLQIGTNITANNLTITNAQINPAATAITVTVSAAPSGSGSIAFKSTLGTNNDLAVLPTAAAGTSNLNVSGQQFTIITKGGTGAPESTLTASETGIAILEPPEIVSATKVSDTAIDVVFSANISGTSAALGANAVDDTLTASNPVFLIEQGAGSMTNISTMSGTSARDSSNNALVHITGINGTVVAGNTIKFRTAGSRDITNALGAINGPNTTTAVPINPQGSVISSVSIDGAPAYTGDGADTGFYTRNTFTTTIVGTAGATIKTRIPSGTSAVTGVTWTNTAGDVVDSTGGVGTILIPTAGTTTVTASLSGNSLVATGNKALTATVQASLDNFTTSTSSTSGDLIIDRGQPRVVAASCSSPDRNTIIGQFSEDVSSATVVPTGFTLGGANSGATINSAALGSDKKSFTLTTTLLIAATNNTVAATTTIKDLAGNKADTTASNTFSTMGSATTGTSITGIRPDGAQAGSLIVSNGDAISVTITGPTGNVSSIGARLVNAADNSITNVTTGAVSITETGVGVYTGTVVLTSAGSGVNAVKVQGTMDGFAQVTTSSESLTVDNTAPKVSSATGVGSTAALLEFNEIMASNLAITDTTNYDIIGSLSGTRNPTSATLRPGATQVLLKFTSTTPGETATIDVKNVNGGGGNGVRDLTYNLINHASNTVGIDRATYTAPPEDNTAPTIQSTSVAGDGSYVKVIFTDNSGQQAVEIESPPGTKTRITSVTKDGVPQSGVVTNNTTEVSSTFTPPTPFSQGSGYLVSCDVYDLKGNFAVRTSSFTVCGTPVASANPETVMPNGTSTVSASGAFGSLTAEITSDTSGGATISGGGGPWTVTAGPGSPDQETEIVVKVTAVCSSATVEVTITVLPQCVLTVSATKSAVDGEKISVGATGGVLPYVYELTTATPTGAAIDPLSGDYLAPAAGATEETETIKATDANGCSGTTTVKVSQNAVAVHTVGSGTASVTIHGPAGATYAIDDGVGSVTSGGVFTSSEDGVAVVKVTSTEGEWAKVVIVVEGGICTVKEPVPVQDVNMDGTVGLGDLTPVIDAILAP